MVAAFVCVVWLSEKYNSFNEIFSTYLFTATATQCLVLSWTGKSKKSFGGCVSEFLEEEEGGLEKEMVITLTSEKIERGTP